MKMLPMTAPMTAAMTAMALALAAPVAAQESVTLEVAESQEYGQYLTTSDGRPVYMFTADTQATEGQDAEIACTSQECLDAWPLVDGGVAPGDDAVNADMIGTVNYEGQQVALYNGWPLYYYAQDQGADAPQGNDIESFGGEWYLVTPEGEPVGH